MIINKTPLTLAEVREYLKDSDDKRPINLYLKKFCKTNKETAFKMGDEIRKLQNPKIKEEDIVKIIDIMPKDSEDVNKIFSSVSLSEEESQAVLSVLKNY